MGLKGQRATVVAVAIAMWLSLAPALGVAGGTEGRVWLNCDPGERAHGGGWEAGGFVCLPGEFEPNAVLSFDLIIENRDNEDQTDLQVVLAIHSLSPPTTGDDLVSVTLIAPDGTSTTFVLADFGTSEFNPFDESYGGRHHVYVGTDAIWKNYDYPGVVAEGETVRVHVEVRLGADPSAGFEIHFDAFDRDTGAKSPNGHDVTLVSGAPGQPTEGPTACIFGGEEITVFEGDAVTFDGTCSTEGSAPIVGYVWDFDLAMDSDGDGDPTNDADATGAVVTFTWYDDYESEVQLVVTDADGLTDSAIQDVTVLNVAPLGSFDGAFIDVDLSLRVAGEKWHNINLEVHRNYNRTTGTSDGIVGALEVERWPGNPTENPSAGDTSIPLRLDVAGGDTFTAVITYDPFADEGDAVMGDQPINGQVWGDNPIWLVFTFPDGSTCRLFHNFNVRQSLHRNRDTPAHFAEPWIVDLNGGAGAGQPIEFVASASEPGSDDVTFTWDFGDGTVVSTTHLYDAVRGPDPAMSPYEPYMGGTLPPLSLTDTAVHTYATTGTYTVTLTVSDDDGGFAILTFDVEVGEGFGC
jgi:hypothetical protein